MNSYPSTGDGLQRLLEDMNNQILQLKLRDAELARRIDALEIQVADLETRVLDLETP